MDRAEEIKQMLKHLLSQTKDAIKNNQYSSDIDEIVGSCEGVLKNAEVIKQYLNEWNQ